MKRRKILGIRVLLIAMAGFIVSGVRAQSGNGANPGLDEVTSRIEGLMNLVMSDFQSGKLTRAQNDEDRFRLKNILRKKWKFSSRSGTGVLTEEQKKELSGQIDEVQESINRQVGRPH